MRAHGFSPVPRSLRPRKQTVASTVYVTTLPSLPTGRAHDHGGRRGVLILMFAAQGCKSFASNWLCRSLAGDWRGAPQAKDNLQGLFTWPELRDDCPARETTPAVFRGRLRA